MNLSDVLKKYSLPTPRYTSYPMVPAWTSRVEASDYHQHLNAIQHNEHLSLYFHLPFCDSQCHYCGCSRIVTSDHSQSQAYTETLVKEIQLISSTMSSNSKEINPKHDLSVSDFQPKADPSSGGRLRISNFKPSTPPRVAQVHLGGGSPNFFQPSEISCVMQAVREKFTIATDAEIAIEINPRPGLESFYENLIQEGFNRISLGVQDFDHHVQQLINRHQTFESTRDAVQFLRSLGLEHFNFDLICGLPGQTVDTFLDTLKKVLELSPSRIATYAYAHVPWVFPVQRSFDEKDLPSTETRIALFELTETFLTEHGYVPIGMDHFAKKDDALSIALKNKTLHRNFMGYTTQANAHQIGFGMTAISCVNGNYFQNQKDLNSYTQAINQQHLATHKGHLSSKDDMVRRDLIMRLMCQQYVDICDFESKHDLVFKKYFEKDIPLLAQFIHDELLDVSDHALTVIPPGHLVLRNIAQCFDAYLEQTKKNAENPVFSKTI